jgi:alginate biosynthesis protein AlgK
MKRQSFFSGLMLLLLAGFSLPLAAMPDLRRGQAALDAGDRAGAEREFRALADFGLPEAQIALGDMLSAGPPAQRRVKEALEWYLRAGQRDSRGYSRIASLYTRDYTVDPADIDAIIDKLVKRHDRGERALAGDIGQLLMARGGGHNLPEVAQWAKRAKDWGDVRGSLQLGMLCDVPLARKVDAQCAQKNYREAAPHLAEAAGRLIALQQRYPELGASVQTAGRLKAAFPPPERYSMYRTYLKGVAGVPQMGVAEVLLVDLFNENTRPVRSQSTLALELVDPEQMQEDPLIYDPTDAAIELLSAYTKNTGPEAKRKFLTLLPYLQKVRPLEAALMEADVYIDGTLLPAEPKRAEAALLPWATRSAAAAFQLGEIYRIGYIDEPDYEAAILHYEIAGKAGLPRAWYSLTRLYLGAPAFMADRSRAQLYADNARKAGYAQVDYLLENQPELQGAR